MLAGVATPRRAPPFVIDKDGWFIQRADAVAEELPNFDAIKAAAHELK